MLALSFNSHEIYLKGLCDSHMILRAFNYSNKGRIVFVAHQLTFQNIEHISSKGNEQKWVKDTILRNTGDNVKLITLPTINQITMLEGQ